MIRAVVAGAFEDLRSKDIRFLQEATRSGPVTAVLWNDLLTQRLTGTKARFPEDERKYLLGAIRVVERVQMLNECIGKDALPTDIHTIAGDAEDEFVWVVRELEHSPEKERFCNANGIGYHVVPDRELQGFPSPCSAERNSSALSSEGRAACPHPAADNLTASISTRKKVIVTGCYDWLHSGHVRFFEEVSVFGDLYVVVGHDANIRLLKGPGHPLLSQDERRYVVGSVKHVTEVLISTGEGWLDAEPEIARLRPDIYAVNEDGDKGGKRDFCEKHGIEYLVLKRRPAPGLPARTSTDLRGF